MTLVLGIHAGHDAACALVRDGVVVAALAQERVTRIKHDGQESLSNRLPAAQCLATVGATLRDVDVIVSSFQAASPGGIGLHRPLVEPGFDLFDPGDPRHFVISHHQAHALGALGLSGCGDAAVLVCDLGGSTTCGGQDFFLTFDAFQRELAALESHVELRTECLSIYESDGVSLTLAEREFCVPHNAPDVFVQNVASLYDNVARMVFGKEHAHGQLMALASMDPLPRGSTSLRLTDIVSITAEGEVQFRNDWQIHVSRREDVLGHAALARAVQRALEDVLLQYARRARAWTTSSTLAVSGGVFLNIPANSRIAASGLFDTYYVPSAPHDSGIAIGCAFAGWRAAGGTWRGRNHRSTDRLGPVYPPSVVDEVLRAHAHLVSAADECSLSEIAALLEAGHIIARWSGRSEFGPRALGGRSLLASPLSAHTKSRLNAIKGRQEWRPVAPIVQRERVGEFFDGPTCSPYMNFVHVILPEHREHLPALSHPDASTRVQTLERSDDRDLYELLGEFGTLTGYPVLVNTSLNGPGQPIVETAADAFEFFRTSTDVDAVWIGGRLVRRSSKPSWLGTRLAHDVIISIIHPGGTKRIFLLRRGAALEISIACLDAIERLTAREQVEPTSDGTADDVSQELVEAVRYGMLVPAT
ncbi:MAG TPA: carbamoyltransferase C-terminal domain-containing protein [Longimicrobium sp.]